MEKNDFKVLIIVKGGVVQSIYSSNPEVKFDILDFDNEELENNIEEENLFAIKNKEMTAVL